MKRILATLGPSGCGKTDARARLIGKDRRFRLIPAFTTRELRDQEIDRIRVTADYFEALVQAGDLVAVNSFFGASYGTSKQFIDSAIAFGNIPLLDWPIKALAELIVIYSSEVFTVYMMPPSIEELARRLARDGRDPKGARLQAAIDELAYFTDARPSIDLTIVSHRDAQVAVADQIYQAFCQS